LISIWPEVDPNQSALGAAYILLHEAYTPQIPSIRRGIRLLESAKERGPVDIRALYSLAVGHAALNESRAAIEQLRRVLDREPAFHEARLRLAIAYEQAKREPEAIVEYQRLLDTVPDWLEPYPRLVRLLLKRNDIDQAAGRLAQQLARHPDSSALTGMAVVQVLRGNPASESLRWINRALQLDPRHPTARQIQRDLEGR
jgi:tetratricopeptide (TPR) repeat protein